MVKIDLITGFLGSGKTTFIRKYAQYLMDAGNNIGILENDYGAVNVDMMLLQDLMGENCELEMISGGCDKDCHRRRFKTKLIAMGMCGYDRVIVEPSGIFDVDEFFDILHEEPLNRWYQIGNVIAIVDSKLERDLSEEADFILASEVADAGCIVMSKSQDASPEEIRGTIEHVNQALEKVHCSRRFHCEMNGVDTANVIHKNWDEFQEIFDQQDEQYKEAVLPNAMRKRLSVEMASSFGWHKYVGLDGITMSIDEFGKSAPAQDVIQSYGFTVDGVVENIEKLLK